MKVLYVTLRDFPQLVANRVQTMKMAEAFAQQSDFVLTVSRLNVTEQELWSRYGVTQTFAINVLGEPILRPHSFFGFPSVALSVLRNKPDLIFCREERLTWMLSLFFKNVVYEMHSISDMFSKLYPRLVGKTLKTIAVSHGLKDAAVASGLDGNKIMVCPAGVDQDMLENPVSMADARKMVGLPDEAKIVLYSGRLSKWKGVNTLVESAKHLSEGTLLVIVGGIEGEPESIAQLVSRTGVADKVRVLGHREHSQMKFFQSAADVLVCPNSPTTTESVSFTSPLKLKEYMASRRPIVASDLPSLREVLGEIAVYAPADDQIALADAIKVALKGGPDIDEKVEAAYQKVQSQTWANRAKEILAMVADPGS